MYYSHTVGAIRTSIREKFPGAQPEAERGPDNLPNYLLWMLDKVEAMDVEITAEATKAAFWIGWICCMVEEQLRLWDKNHTRTLVGLDRRNQLDLPLSAR